MADGSVFWFLALCFVPLGLLSVGYAIPLQALVRRKWPSTNGVITSAATEDYPTRTSKYWVTTIGYDYSYMGVSYSASQDIPYERSYAPGQVVPVYYNPNRPQESFVELLLEMSVIRLVIGLSLLFVGIAVVFLDEFPAMILMVAMIGAFMLIGLVKNAIWGRRGPTGRR